MSGLDNEQTGSIGETEVHGRFARIGWGPIPNHLHDRGIDLVLQVRSARGADMPVFVNAQVKAGRSWFGRPVTGRAGRTIGWWFRDSVSHMRGWIEHSVPTLIVLYDLDGGTAYWQHITNEHVRWSSKTAKLVVPAANTVSEQCREALIEVAGAQRLATSWEGSTWRAGTDIPAPDLLRYALIAPRLVAPHPNAGTATAVAPEQAVAMLMLGRVQGLEQQAEQHRSVPRLDDALGHPNWHWRFAAAMHAAVMDEDLAPTLALVGDAPTSETRAAAAVTTAAALIQRVRIDEAVTLLDEAIGAVAARSVDAAWLRVQRGRALAEAGRYADAQGDLLEAQSVRLEAPGDVTATGIAGAALKLLFTIAPWSPEEFEAVIVGSDTATSWWRAQTTSYGLWRASNRAFQTWAWDRDAATEGDEVVNNQLEAAGLMATHVGDHRGWAELAAAAAENRLVRLDRAADAAHVADALDGLRLAGERRAVAAAVQRIVADGPAEAVTLAAARIDLRRSTRTTVRADLVLLERAGDVLDEPTAARAAEELLGLIVDPVAFGRRTRPTFFLREQLIRTLAAALPAAPLAVQRAVAAHLVAQPAVEDRLDARAWARVAVKLRDDAWSVAALSAAARDADRHEALLRLALLGAAARLGDGAARRRLLDAALEGSLDALAQLGELSALPKEVVTEQIADLASEVQTIRAAVRTGVQQFPAHDHVYVLTLLNLWHPDVAAWDPVLDLLADDAVSAWHKDRALDLLSRMSDLIADEVRPRLAAVAAGLVRGVGAGPVDPFTGRSIAGEAALLAAAVGSLTEGEAIDRLMELLGGDRADRLLAAALAVRIDSADIAGVLAALAGDHVPDLRATAIHGLARRLLAGDLRPVVVQTLRAALGDGGTRVSSALAAALAGQSGPVVDELREGLRSSPSASVRALAASG